MTKELLNEIENDYWEEKADPIDMTEVFDLASKALEQQPCEDCISRLIVQEEISKSIALKENPHQMYKRIQAIPSVTPKAENEEQYKADLQGAYDCGYNCGYTDAMSDIYERGDSE